MSRDAAVLVTGGAGFVGSELVRQLVESGRRVVVLDNLVNGRRENLDGLPGPQLKLAVGDLRDEARLPTLLEGVTHVFHLACLGVRHSIHSPRENHEVNATATLPLLAAARRAGVERFVHVSSSEVYGTACSVPMTEEHPTRPTTVYGASKLAGEAYARAYHATYGLPSVVIRPFNTYGPRSHHEGDSGEVIPRFLLRALVGEPLVIFGDGLQTRDFSYVSDTAAGILRAAFADGVVGETVNLGSGRETTILELAAEVGSVATRTPRIVHEASRPGDVRRHRAGVEKARRLLGWEPRVSLPEGLARLRDWYHARGPSPRALLREECLRGWERPGGESRGS